MESIIINIFYILIVAVSFHITYTLLNKTNIKSTILKIFISGLVLYFVTSLLNYFIEFIK
jgi:cellulose synthase/poly-beta-1,6-N-acetylglucosamine synthase-like glycosyltransferase